MKYTMKLFKSFLILSLLFVVAACQNPFADIDSDSSSGNTSLSDGKTYITINTQQTSISRTIYPSTSISFLSNFVLSGKLAEDPDLATELATASNIEELNQIVVELDDAGLWEFTFQGDCDIGGETVPFTQTKEITIVENRLNVLSFELTAPDDYEHGGLSISVSFTPSTNVSSVVATLMSEDETTEIDTRTFTSSDFEDDGDAKKITYSMNIASNAERLSSGSYYLKFDFLSSDISESLALIQNYVRIISGVTTTAALSVELNAVYTITYQYYLDDAPLSGSTGISIASGSSISVLPGAVSRKSSFTLPAMQKSGATFNGWYTDTSFTDEAQITSINKGTSSNITLYGKFTSSGGNSIIEPAASDFVNISNAAYYDISGMENNPVGPNGEYVFPKMKVLKREVTQAEYESFMTYETGFVPTEDESAKATTSAYYVSWAEALIYCNLLSIHQGLEPVYQMRLNLDGTNKLYTDPADWAQDENTGIRTSNGKYYLDPSGVDANEYGEQTYWQQDFNDGAHIVYNNAANGYRLPLVNEWAYITNLAQAGTISDMTDNTKNVYEWCSGCNYNYDFSQSYVTQNMGSSWDDSNSFTSTDTKPYVHEGMSNLGFRIIRYTLQDDFVNVEGQNNHEVYDGDFDTLQLNSINSGDTYNIKNLLVQKEEVTQSDYELFMNYTSGYEPTESGEAKKSTPAYYVSWAEAVIYCNMLSLAHDLTPVYGIKWMDGGNLTNHTDPKDWATKTDTGVTISESKYSVTDNNTDTQKAYWIPDYKGESYYFHIDNNANGYRLPTKTEWVYISDKVKNASSGNALTEIDDNSSKNVDEWCLAFDNDGHVSNYCYSTSEMGVAEFSTTNVFDTENSTYDSNQDPVEDQYIRITSHKGTGNIGFRIVRNTQ